MAEARKQHVPHKRPVDKPWCAEHKRNQQIEGRELPIGGASDTFQWLCCTGPSGPLLADSSLPTTVMFGQIPSTQFDLRFSVLGIPVRVHPIFWITSVFLAWVPEQLDRVFVRVLCVFVSILVHELGHAVVTRSFGWYPEIVLYILGGYATTTRHTAWKDIAVSAAGPAAGFLLFFAIWFPVRFRLFGPLPQSELILDALGFSLFINLAWNVMNLMPVLPLDGGHISRSFCEWISPRRGRQTSLLISLVSAGAITLWSVRAMNRHEGVLGLEPMFLALMFGYLGFQSYQQYQAARRGYY